MIRHINNWLLLALVLAWLFPLHARAEPHRPHTGAQPTRVALAPAHHPPSHHLHALPTVHRPMPAIAATAVHATPVIRPVITTYVARPLAPIVPVPPRVVAVPSPYFVIVGSGYTGSNLAFPAEPAWNWTPVESVAALAGRSDVRYFCPDTRSYYPEVEACPSPWLKVVP